MFLTVDGRRAFAYTGGKAFDPALPCAVFIHGASHDHTVWNLLARWFAHHGWGVLALALPGHLRSDGPLLPDVEALAAWTWRVVDAAGVGRAALVGHSMGSLIALEAAGQQPERASHLVMVGSAYPMAVNDALLAMARDTPDAAMQRVNAWSISTLASKPGFPGPGNWLHGGALALMRRVQAAAPAGVNVFLHDFEACNRYRGGAEAAARVACPTTMILGQSDVMTPPKAATTLAGALRAEVVRLPCGHHLMGEAPDAVLAAVRQALS
jgi:pimeloyl-ACP methyl ester carboxylesterase